MDEHDWLAERFEENRPHLRAVAYRVLGSASEADDAVQEAWLRFSRAGADEVENLGGWLTTIVARVSLNMLQSRRLRREDPMDAGVDHAVAGGMDPEHEAVLADSVGLALLDPDIVLRPDAFVTQMGGIGEVRGATAAAATFSGRARVPAWRSSTAFPG
jgi:DNA-directed RNA polymerase specialized sigma24 family protein